jgi:Fe2+ or Zn2+ uptake regulation protein
MLSNAIAASRASPPSVDRHCPSSQEGSLVEGIETIIEPVCAHHWRIEAPSGATSHAICRKCGEEREFRNSETEHPYRMQRTKRA